MYDRILLIIVPFCIGRYLTNIAFATRISNNNTVTTKTPETLSIVATRMPALSRQNVTFAAVRRLPPFAARMSAAGHVTLT